MLLTWNKCIDFIDQVPVGTIDSDSEHTVGSSSASEGSGPYSWERPIGEVIHAVRDAINSDEDTEDPTADIRQTMHGHIQDAVRDGYIANGFVPAVERLQAIVEADGDELPSDDDQWRCWRCQGFGHWSRDCPSRETLEGRRARTQCRVCYEFGRWAGDPQCQYNGGSWGSQEPPRVEEPCGTRSETPMLTQRDRAAHSRASDQVVWPPPEINMPRVTPLRIPERYDLSTPPNERRREGRPLAEVLTDVLMHRPISERENRMTRHLRRRFQDPAYEQNSNSDSNE